MWKFSEASQRLMAWREFRKKISALPLEQALEEIAEFWQPCPFSPYYLDPDQPDTWPSPWNLIADNYYCDLAKSLGMLYTIGYSDHGSQHSCEIQIYQESTTQYIYNLVVIDQGRWILNFASGEVVNSSLIDEDFKLLKKHNINDLADPETVG